MPSKYDLEHRLGTKSSTILIEVYFGSNDFYQFVGFTFGETVKWFPMCESNGVKHKQKSKLRIYLAQNGDYGGLPYPCLIQGVIFEALMKAERIKRIFRFLKTCKLKSRLMRDTLHENGDPFIFVVTLW